MEATEKTCCNDTQTTECCAGPPGLEILPMAPAQATDEPDDAPCCGPPAGPRCQPEERPGFRIWDFVDRFADTPAGPVPIVAARWNRQDMWGTVGARVGATRSHYRVAPGLYGIGNPDAGSPVLVSANYKLSFDHLRRPLADTSAWILVVDTRGINVWCAAGKGTFSTVEVVAQVKASGLDKVVDHRRLILPQLAATGVAARKVRRQCGFEVVWGPIRAADLPTFLAGGQQAEPAMRQVTFTLAERAVLVPVELYLSVKPLLWAVLAAMVLSGIGPHIFSLGAAWHRGLTAAGAAVTGLFCGAVAAPLLLPWLPGRTFALKGVIAGLAGALITVWRPSGGLGAAAVQTLIILAISSYVAMNFTGSTPFTSPSGVEKEMRRAIPLQAAAVLVAAGIWIALPFLQ